ncbi:RNA-directed DNA polymerase from mobile element jockey [Araneus ventricosus]|uniref:RNA-directed DNA polymerase from mobile element jockey n=1 Tax=Araneus ventricosus TaxID=182803 RepID=A0A4Y2WPH7_ARAVE|nr:RNA-directed DNA polymerase from mobile element jockey [Araneus ventricosus]
MGIAHHEVNFDSITFENSAICIDLPNKKQITVVSIYRPPHGLIDTAELNRIFCSNSQVICFGDFNAKHSSWNIGRSNRNGYLIYDWVNNNNFSIIAPLQPTYFSSSYALNATLDFAVVKNISAAEAVAINALPSDHNPVWFEFLLSNVLPIPLRSLTTTNWNRFQDIISRNIPGNPTINSIRDIEEAIAKFECGINTAINLSSKTKSINTVHRKLPPFITNKITRRNNIRKRWQHTRYPPYKTACNKLSEEIKNDIEVWDNNRWKELLQGLNTEDISLFNMARKLTKKYVSIPPILGPSGLVFSCADKADIFRNALEESFQENIEPYDDNFIEKVENEIDDYFHTNNSPSPAPLSSPAEILTIIAKLNIRKTSGPDKIPNKALKLITPNALTFLTKIFNKCLTFNYFPLRWKQANIIMLSKPGKDPKFPQSYRPISLLSSLGKIFEKILQKRINSYCDSSNIIPKEQFGFRAQHSTIHQLLRVTNSITEGMNNKFYTGGIFLDIQKAFDRVWHDGLIYKLIQLNFPKYLINILKSFLENRTFKVVIHGETSNTGVIKAGTPQGSVLSPILYSIFTSDFPSHPRTITCLFADDSAVLAQGTTIKYILRTLQSFLASLEEWLTKWRIAVNTDKTKAIIFRKGCSNFNPTNLELFDETIEWVTEVKYLGLIIDNKLTFRQHISYLKEKFWAKIYLCLPLIGRNSSLSLENKLILFKQVLRPILTYAAPIWGLAAPSNRKKVQILQNKLLRIIVNAPWFIRNSVIHSDLQIESIDDHIQKLSRKFFSGIVDHPNNLIADQTDFTEFTGRYRYPYTTTKWSLPLKPP